jgi:Na+-translocating ferredoxin:NAD+ oxidoreductase RNF subunit RnfB
MLTLDKRGEPIYYTRPDLKCPAEAGMTYVITEPCVGTLDASCAEVCPVDCIHPRPGRRFERSTRHGGSNNQTLWFAKSVPTG